MQYVFKDSRDKEGLFLLLLLGFQMATVYFTDKYRR